MKHPHNNKFLPIDDILWTVEQIVTNTIAHYDYLKNIDVQCTDKCIFFADNGCGEHFGYKLTEGTIDMSIYVYYPIDNRFRKIASNIKEWAEGWFSGKIST